MLNVLWLPAFYVGSSQSCSETVIGEPHLHCGTAGIWQCGSHTQAGHTATFNIWGASFFFFQNAMYPLQENVTWNLKPKDQFEKERRRKKSSSLRRVSLWNPAHSFFSVFITIFPEGFLKCCCFVKCGVSCNVVVFLTFRATTHNTLQRFCFVISFTFAPFLPFNQQQ